VESVGLALLGEGWEGFVRGVVIGGGGGGGARRRGVRGQRGDGWDMVWYSSARGMVGRVCGVGAWTWRC